MHKNKNPIIVILRNKDQKSPNLKAKKGLRCPTTNWFLHNRVHPPLQSARWFTVTVCNIWSDYLLSLIINLFNADTISTRTEDDSQ